ncbi:fungal-specific transcription factor [Achaetomium macrosporum]|uniref:Fungal-specific transcription factor n=1 Tax=Achaetomium macrosporum TaxID=79813 RepID=A0AAN7C4I0_9PEZI|nr:fungal-specific transcription factor [Achaetomium macrosporum]
MPPALTQRTNPKRSVKGFLFPSCSYALGNLDDRPRTNAPFPCGPSCTTSASPNLTPGRPATASPASCETHKILTPKLEYEGESSLSAQAAFANRFLRDAIVNRPSVDITREMASVLDSLSTTLGTQTDQQDADYLYPHAKPLEPGCTVRNLPMPPVESAFTCLRMAKEHSRVRFFWNHEANSVARFTEFFLKVYSPGDANHADLIIVNAGLYWLFNLCKSVSTEPGAKAHYAEQATMCRDNLETVLSNLPFHLPSSLDTTSAMAMAAMYCIEVCKPSAAWNFIATASHMSQTLGMHNIVAMTQDSPEHRAQKIKMFWIIYIYEKALSLRLGRSSTIRDGDVTVPLPMMDSRSEVANLAQMKKWVEFARLQGMVYDQIYSPAALIQPQAIRVARARHLASELQAHTTKITADDRRYKDAMRQAIGVKFFDAFDHITSVSHLSLFCLLYRAIPPEPSDGTVFGKDCIASAREALEEHKRSMAILTDVEDDFLEPYVNWALLQSPFVPFTVLFCHVIETCNQADLDRLGNLVEILQSNAADFFSPGVKKELRLFKVLYDVACSYMKLKTEAVNRPGDSGVNAWDNGATLLMQPPFQQPTLMPTADSTGHQNVPQMPFLSSDGSGLAAGTAFGEGSSVRGWATGASFAMPGDLTMEVDQQGTELGNWLYMNNQMMRVLEDNYF